MCFPPKSELWAAGHTAWQNKQFQTNAPAASTIGISEEVRVKKDGFFFLPPNGSENCSQPGWIDNSILLKLTLAAKKLSENQPSPHPARWKRAHSLDLRRARRFVSGSATVKCCQTFRHIHADQSGGSKWRSKKTVLPCFKKSWHTKSSKNHG